MSTQGGSENLAELYPSVGAGASVYGDRDASSHGAYSTFLASVQQNYPAHPWFFWDQPLSDSGWVQAHAGTNKGKNNGEHVSLGMANRLFLVAATSALLHVLLFL